MPLMAKEVEVVALFNAVADGWRVSLRSKGDVDVRQVALLWHGGGHRNAAGLTVTGGLPRRACGRRRGRRASLAGVTPASAATWTACCSIDKPAGPTSHDVVRACGARAASHGSDTPARSIRARPDSCRWSSAARRGSPPA